MTVPSSPTQEEFVSRALEATIRIGLVLLLAAWCLAIIRPFLNPFVWSVIIAIATRGLFVQIERAVGGRDKLAAALYVGAGLLLIIVPAALLTTSLVDEARVIAEHARAGELRVPPPPPAVGHLPLVGEPLRAFWQLASENLEAAMMSVSPHVRPAIGVLIDGVASAGMAVVTFALAIVIAAVLHANAGGSERIAHAVARRLAGERGPELAVLAGATIRNVTRGILGVALIQAILAGLGMVAVGVPAAGLWALLCLLVAVVQVPMLLVLLPVAIYVFSQSGTALGVVFLVWSVLVGLLDNVLKPLLLGRGSEMPMLVIFLGAIGGFIASGIIGLFVGAIVLSVGYKLFLAWLDPADA